jgi:hypothetical protein
VSILKNNANNKKDDKDEAVEEVYSCHGADTFRFDCGQVKESERVLICCKVGWWYWNERSLMITSQCKRWYAANVAEKAVEAVLCETLGGVDNKPHIE